MMLLSLYRVKELSNHKLLIYRVLRVDLDISVASNFTICRAKLH
jgi:hypothetical protein